MAWSISITDEGWQDIYKALQSWPKEDLVDALLDAEAEEAEEEGQTLDCQWYRDMKALYTIYERDTLVNMCYERIEQTGTCDNGRYAYWIDREGYWKVVVTDSIDSAEGE